MKTLIRSLLMSLGVILSFTGCGSSSNNNSTATAATTYYLSNGYCYGSTTGTQVATTYCSTTATSYNSAYFSYNGTTCTNLQTGTAVNAAYCTSNPFTYNGSGCYDSLSGTYVATNYCSTSSATGTTSTGYNAQVCYGPYYYYNGYNAQLVQCYGANCRGAILYNVSTKTPVVCQ